jgi:hypothetical protein
MVRVGYVVPTNRTAQPGAVQNLQDLIRNVQDWYGNQMQRYGFGYKTFQFETEADGVTPKINVVSTSMTDATIRTDTWGKTIDAATGAGLPIWAPGQAWLLVPESHLEQSDGSIIGGTALGASFGSGSDPGVATLGSDGIFRWNSSMLQNTAAYAGMTVPQVGPYPFVQDVSFPWFEGNTFSSIASAIQGAVAHELGHAFGLAHDFRNDDNYDGILMGNGLRGWRGSRLPTQFPDDDAQLGYAESLALGTSRYFNPTLPVTDVTKPNVNILTSGSVNPINGLLPISFTAVDSGGLAAALLRRNGETIEELTLSGASTSAQFNTSWYTPGQNDTFEISVYDGQGNKASSSVPITVTTGFNRAPQPFIDPSRSAVNTGQLITLDASQSQDPDGSSSTMLVQWDIDGNGIYDTSPMTTKTFAASYSIPGDYKVFAKLTDAAGAVTISDPLVVHVTLASVPEPSGVILGLTALVATIGARRLRRQSIAK